MYVREIPFFIKRYQEPINLLKGVLFQSIMLHNSWQAEPTLVKRCWERKAFRILGLGERKGRWGMEQDFHWDFQVNVTWFFASFSGVLDWIVLILVCSDANSTAFGGRLTLFCLVSCSPALVHKSPAFYIHYKYWILSEKQNRLSLRFSPFLAQNLNFSYSQYGFWGILARI